MYKLYPLLDIKNFNIECTYMSKNTVYPVIFAFFATSFKSQIMKYAETLSCIIFHKKLFKSHKMTDAY